jgi:hypothetical protein
MLLLISMQNYPFPWFGLIDSWLYSSLQWNPSAILEQFRDTYYATRVPSFASGILLHKFFQPDHAAIIYKLFFSSGICAGWAIISYRIGGLFAALLSIAIGVISPWLVVMRSTEYVDVAILFYASLGLGFSALAYARPNYFIFSVISGFCLISAAMANLSTVAIFGPAFIVYCILQPKVKLSTHFRIFLGSLMGGVASIILFGFISVSYGGHFFILWKQFLILESLPLVGNNPWAPKNWLWLASAGWLLLPVSATIWGLVYALSEKKTILTIKPLYAAHVICCSTACVFEFIGTPVLSKPFYAIYLYLTSVPMLVICAARNKACLKLNKIYIFVFFLITISLIVVSYQFIKPAGLVSEYFWVILFTGGVCLVLSTLVENGVRVYNAIHQIILWSIIVSSWTLFTNASDHTYGKSITHDLEFNSDRDNYGRFEK